MIELTAVQNDIFERLFKGMTAVVGGYYG